MYRVLSLAGLLVLLAPLRAQEKPPPEKRKPPSKIEQEIVKLTNQVRAKQNKSALQINDLLMQAARHHAANMARQNQMSHVLDGKNPADRVKDAGYEYSYVAENVAMGQRTALEVMKMWMNSETHRGNILGENYTEIGVAAVKGPRGLYFVQVFGTPVQKEDRPAGDRRSDAERKTGSEK